MQNDLKQHIVNLMTLRYDPLDSPGIKLRKWQDFLSEDNRDNETKVLDLVKGKIEDKVCKYDKVAVALSGGVDSTFILNKLREVSKDIKVVAICANFGDIFDETEKARRIAHIHKCTFKSMKIVDPFARLEELVGIVGEPRWNLYFDLVLEEAKKDCELVLTGDGGDELFGGYTFRYSKFLSCLKSDDGWREKTVNYLSCHERDWVPDQEHLFGKNVVFEWDEIYRLFRSNFDNSLSPLDQVMMSDFNGKLAFDWVPTNKKLSEHVGIECYAPILEEDVIKLATHIPNSRKYDPKLKTGKMILKESLQQKGLVTGDDKIGFGMDMATMWERAGKKWIDRYLGADSSVVKKGIVDGAWLKHARAMADIERSPRYINKLFSILSLEFWLKQSP